MGTQKTMVVLIGAYMNDGVHNRNLQSDIVFMIGTYKNDTCLRTYKNDCFIQ